MKNIVFLQKNKDGSIYCSQLTQDGKHYIENNKEKNNYWEQGRTILLDELNEILDKEI